MPGSTIGSRVAATALAAMAALAVSFATDAAAHAAVPCRPAPGTTTIAHTSKARLFEDDLNGNDYACLYSNGHPRYLSTTEHYEYRLVRFAAPYVAFEPLVEAVPSGVEVMNMATGHLHGYEAGGSIENMSCSEVNSLEVKTDGSLAWIATDFPPQCGETVKTTIEVRVHDRHGSRLLDSGAGIVPTSLHLSGSRLTWIDGGLTRSATLY